MNFEVALCGSAFYVALPFVIPNKNDNIHQMTERRACDVTCVTKRIFVHSFIKPQDIRLLDFDIRFTINLKKEVVTHILKNVNVKGKKIATMKVVLYHFFRLGELSLRLLREIIRGSGFRLPAFSANKKKTRGKQTSTRSKNDR